MRTVREYEAAGVAALHIEDQVVAEALRAHGGQAGHRGRRDGREGPRRGRGARSPDLLIIARTDARAVEGLDAALERARRYRDAGADVAVRRGARERGRDRGGGAGVPGHAAAVQRRRRRHDAAAPARPPRASSASALVLCPVTTLFAAARAVQQALARPAAQREAARRRRAVVPGLHRPHRAAGDPAPRSPLRGRARTAGPDISPAPMRAGRLVVLTALAAGSCAGADSHNTAEAKRPPLRTTGHRGPAHRGGAPRSRWRSRHCTSLPLVVAQ